MNAADPLRYQAGLEPRRIAVSSGGGDLTFAQLDRRANQVARMLLSLGLKPGDRLGILVGNCREHVELLFGAARAGVVSVTYEPTAPPAELGTAFDGLELDALVLEDRHLDPLYQFWRRLGLSKSRVVVVGGNGHSLPRYDELVEAADEIEVFGLAGDRDPLTIMRTSGTTGRPKSLLIHHATYVARNTVHGLVFRTGPSDIALCCLPLHFGAGRGLLFGALAFGAKVIVHETFDATRVLETIEQERVTVLSMVPTMYLRLLETIGVRHFDTSSLRVMMVFGGVLDEGLAHRIRAELNPNLYNHYASTDIGSIAVLHPEEESRKPGSVGRPIWPLEVRALGEDGEPLPPGQVGEIVCRGPLVLDGYLEDEPATAELQRSGWLPTGDLGMLDLDGYLYIRGRKKRVIKSGGMSVQADEIEHALQAHPGVREAAVFGLPDPVWSERVCAAVVLVPDSASSTDDLLVHCRGLLASYKLPKSIYLVEQLPYTSLGKIAYQRLTEQFGVPATESLSVTDTTKMDI